MLLWLPNALEDRNVFPQFSHWCFPRTLLNLIPPFDPTTDLLTSPSSSCSCSCSCSCSSCWCWIWSRFTTFLLNHLSLESITRNMATSSTIEVSETELSTGSGSGCGCGCGGGNSMKLNFGFLCCSSFSEFWLGLDLLFRLDRWRVGFFDSVSLSLSCTTTEPASGAAAKEKIWNPHSRKKKTERSWITIQIFEPWLQTAYF